MMEQVRPLLDSHVYIVDSWRYTRILNAEKDTIPSSSMRSMGLTYFKRNHSIERSQL